MAVSPVSSVLYTAHSNALKSGLAAQSELATWSVRTLTEGNAAQPHRRQPGLDLHHNCSEHEIARRITQAELDAVYTAIAQACAQIDHLIETSEQKMSQKAQSGSTGSAWAVVGWLVRAYSFKGSHVVYRPP